MSKKQLEFGITFKGDLSPERTVALAKMAEDAGFTYVWTFDSHILWKDPYPMLTLLAANTRRVRLGTLVTNPAVRDVTVTASLYATLNIISGGRMDMGIGRGDSSRRVLGRRPTAVADLRRASQVIRDLASGKEVDYEGQKLQLKWATGSLPVWVAAYGPKALAMTGEVADGVILQIADPFLVRWFASTVRESAHKTGRKGSDVKVMSAAPVWVSNDLVECRAQVRWFPAMVGNHVADLVERYHHGELPQELTDYIKGRKGYDYHEHADKDADHLGFITDEVIDRFTIVGPAEAHRKKLEELVAAGVNQFNIYLMSGEEARNLEVYGNEIIPAFR
ncbi:MAG: TIGR03842 family LLM class F420-dependent oxidoreductase [Acidobacteriota bacterium]